MFIETQEGKLINAEDIGTIEISTDSSISEGTQLGAAKIIANMKSSSRTEVLGKYRDRDVAEDMLHIVKLCLFGNSQLITMSDAKFAEYMHDAKNRSILHASKMSEK